MAAKKVKRNYQEDVAKLVVGLDAIWMLCVDYDGETTVKGLKGLIDEVRRTSVAIMHDTRVLPKKFKSWKEYAKVRKLDGLPSQQRELL
jgi:S-adenosylmethionine:tRNA-ribosyltransferase-isomerase (queuine synthetase)